MWAERLISHVSDPAWTRAVHQRMVRGRYSEEQYNRDMNALFVKLHLLDPQSVIPAYQHLLNQRGKDLDTGMVWTKDIEKGRGKCFENYILN